MRLQHLTRRVANEVEIHWQLRNPSILELLNYFEDDEYVYLVMELCSNGNLYDYLKAGRSRSVTIGAKRIAEDQVRSVALQLVNGLLYLHSNGIIHRDLKLSNLLLNDKYQLKIADFGLAVKLLDAHSEQKTMCGTPNYISPEIVSRLPYGLSSDVWSLGCMLVTLLTGSPPFQSHQVKNTLEKVANVDYQLPKHVSHHARHLIECLLQKDPKERLPLTEVLSHPFFDTTLPAAPLAPQSYLFSRPASVSEADKENRKTPREPGPDPRPVISNDRIRHPSRDSPHHSRAAGSDLGKGTSAAPFFVPEITTSRLKPLKQNTKHGTIELLVSGNILMDFTADEHIVLVNPVLRTLGLYRRNALASYNEQFPDYTCSLESTPPVYQKTVRYAVKFVELVRSKTPKIIFYSPQAKCCLMENAPNPSFEIGFYDGVKVLANKSHYTAKVPKALASLYASCRQAIQQQDGSLHYSVHLADETKAIDPVFANAIRHSQECVRQCLDINKRVSGSKSQKYPLILKSNQSPTSARNGAVSRPNSPPTSIHPSQASFYTVTPSEDGRRRRPVPSSGPPRSILSDSRRFETNNASSISLKPTAHQAHFLANVGWCVQTVDKQYSMLFTDGTQLLVNPKTKGLEFHDGKGDVSRHVIERTLAAHIKTRLAHFPVFFKLFKD
ncbi:Serine/threonine-protein kinase plk4 [Kappamyces sp. JEL0680]|nr:Serine/threonine-protein kinase plk4 [Kappamyces sp. JEL0680]